MRPGLALYGASPFEDKTAAELGLHPVMSLETSVIATRKVKKNETVGYGGTWKAAHDSTIAIIAAGYGDGITRNLAGGTPILVNGQRAPLVGRVSMDMIAVDVTHTHGRPRWNASSAMGSRAARRGDRPLRGNNPLRVVMRREPASPAGAALAATFPRPQRKMQSARSTPGQRQVTKNPIFTPAS